MAKEVLEYGRIRAGEPCPFLSDCTWITPNCPQPKEKNIRTHPFSCGVARLRELIDQLVEQGE